MNYKTMKFEKYEKIKKQHRFKDPQSSKTLASPWAWRLIKIRGNMICRRRFKQFMPSNYSVEPRWALLKKNPKIE